MKVRKSFKIDGQEVSEQEYMRRRKARGVYSGVGGAYSEARPLESMAFGVHPKQVEAANAKIKEHGIPGVHYKADGHCVFTSRKARKLWLKANHFHDNNSYGLGGDP